MSAPPRDRARAATVAGLLAAARTGLRRVGPHEALADWEEGAELIDIRGAEQIERDGALPGAWVVPRNVLEWRLDPASPYALPQLRDPEIELVVVCNEGYQSSLAAATLGLLGRRASDLEGGFVAWREAGLPRAPASTCTAPVRSRPDDGYPGDCRRPLERAGELLRLAG